MAHIWIFDEEGSEGSWGTSTLAGEGGLIDILQSGPRLLAPAGDALPVTPALYLLPAGSLGNGARWTLLAGSGVGVRVNGRYLLAGIRVLNDRDEILLAGHRLFFSTEVLARAIPFPGRPQAVFCPRCKQKIEPGDLAVACPGCHAWCHQSEKWPCWTYAETCPLCQQQSTSLEAGYNFNPAEL